MKDLMTVICGMLLLSYFPPINGQGDGNANQKSDAERYCDCFWANSCKHNQTEKMIEITNAFTEENECAFYDKLKECLYWSELPSDRQQVWTNIQNEVCEKDDTVKKNYFTDVSNWICDRASDKCREDQTCDGCKNMENFINSYKSWMDDCEGNEIEGCGKEK